MTSPAPFNSSSASGLSLVSLGAVFALLAVAAGAFGAHGLRDRLSPADLQIFETAARYQMYHALALLAVGALAPRLSSATVTWVGRLLFVGSLIFSGTLYFLVLTGPRWLGAITPIGGVLQMTGWFVLALGAWRAGRRQGA